MLLDFNRFEVWLKLKWGKVVIKFIFCLWNINVDCVVLLLISVVYII